MSATGTLWEQSAIRWSEHLVERGRNADAAALLRAVAHGIDDEAALAEAVGASGATIEEVYTVFDATLYRCGRRVRFTGPPCPKSWATDRPCTLSVGHDGACPIADVQTKDQRAMLAQLEAEIGAVVAAVATARPARGGAQ